MMSFFSWKIIVIHEYGDKFYVSQVHFKLTKVGLCCTITPASYVMSLSWLLSPTTRVPGIKKDWDHALNHSMLSSVAKLQYKTRERSGRCEMFPKQFLLISQPIKHLNSYERSFSFWGHLHLEVILAIYSMSRPNLLFTASKSDLKHLR